MIHRFYNYKQAQHYKEDNEIEHPIYFDPAIGAFTIPETIDDIEVVEDELSLSEATGLETPGEPPQAFFQGNYIGTMASMIAIRRSRIRELEIMSEEGEELEEKDLIYLNTQTAVIDTLYNLAHLVGVSQELEEAIEGFRGKNLDLLQ